MGRPQIVIRSNVRFGSKADICAATSHVRFTPNSDRESGHPMVDRRGQGVQTLWGGVRCQTSFVAASEAAFQRTAALLNSGFVAKGLILSPRGRMPLAISNPRQA